CCTCKAHPHAPERASNPATATTVRTSRARVLTIEFSPEARSLEQDDSDRLLRRHARGPARRSARVPARPLGLGAARAHAARRRLRAVLRAPDARVVGGLAPAARSRRLTAAARTMVRRLHPVDEEEQTKPHDVA